MRTLAALASLAALLPGCSEPTASRVDRVTDGDTIVLASGDRVRLLQIDAPEPGGECYGSRASEVLRALLPAGTRVRLLADPLTDRVDEHGRLLRYVLRAGDGLNVNLRLVELGAAAPYFFGGRRGRFATTLERLALGARARGIGLWGACPRTSYRPTRGVDARR